jgi:hypothetical protein
VGFFDGWLPCVRNYQGDYVIDNFTGLGQNIKEAYVGIEERYLSKNGALVTEDIDRAVTGFNLGKGSFNPRYEGCIIS